MTYERQSELLKGYAAFRERYKDGMPDWFGGAYLDGEELVVLAASDPETAVSVAKPEGFTVKPAKYSYRYLEEQKTQIVGALRTPSDETAASGLAERFLGCGIYEPDNKVHVVFEGLTESDREAFGRCVSGSEAVALLEGTRRKKQLSVYPSDCLNCRRNYFTMGYAAQSPDGRYNGFVTCGHIVADVGDLIQKGVTTVASVADLYDNKELDACFAVSSSNVGTHNQVIIEKDVTITDATENFLTGASVVMYGATSGAQKGTVRCCSFDCKEINDLLVCDYQSKTGDSGAPVVLAGTGLVMGIHVAEDSIDGVTLRESVKAVKINAAFNLVIPAI